MEEEEEEEEQEEEVEEQQEEVVHTGKPRQQALVNRFIFNDFKVLHLQIAHCLSFLHSPLRRCSGGVTLWGGL